MRLHAERGMHMRICMGIYMYMNLSEKRRTSMPNLARRSLNKVAPRASRCVCIAVSMSADGVTWSPGTRLLDTLDAGGGRTIDQAVNGILTTSSAVHFYVHHDVSSVWKQSTPKPRAWPHGLIRYTMPKSRLRNLTAQAKRDLAESLAARRPICSQPLAS